MPNATSIHTNVPRPGLIKGLFIYVRVFSVDRLCSVKRRPGPIAPTFIRLSELLEDNQQADNHCEEGNTFNESGGDDHGGTDVATSLGLASHTFHGTLTNLTNTETGTNGGQTGSDGCSEIAPSHLSSNLQ